LSTNNTIRMNSKLVRDNDVIFSDMDGETVMMSIERGEYYGINPIGSRIWSLLETPRTVSALCDTLCPDYDVTPEQCAVDVQLFLIQLVDKGVIKIVNE